MRIYDNTNKLSRSVIERRLQSLDETATANPYKHVNADPEAGPIGRTTYYVGVESTLTDAQIESCLGPMTQTDTDAEADDALLREFQRRVRTHCQRIEDESKARDTELQSRLAHIINWAKTKGYTPA